MLLSCLKQENVKQAMLIKGTEDFSHILQQEKKKMPPKVVV